MPLPLTISCSSKSRLVLPFLVLPFWYLLTRVVPDRFQQSSKTVVCVCFTIGWMKKYKTLYTINNTIIDRNMHTHLHKLQFSKITMYSEVYDMYVRTVPRTAERHIGHSWMVGAQSSQQTRWLHGKNNVERCLSMHTLHSIESFSWRFSSFRLSTSTHKKCHQHEWWMQLISKKTLCHFTEIHLKI